MNDAAPKNPWLIAIVVAVASFMEVLDTTIANVALPYIAGGMGVSEDESSWVVTTYLVANAIILTSSHFLARLLGRKRFFLTCLAAFTASSIACGFAWNLGSLLMFRVVQGLAGGGMVPVAQSILADSFPPEKRSQAFSLFGIAVVVAPVVGPTLGGWLSDNYSWHWCFLINGPVGVAAMALIALHLPAKPQTAEERRQLLAGGFDVVGFMLIATALASLEVVLDRGLIDDWFDSGFITAVAAIGLLSFAAMIPWQLHRPNPLIDVRMVATRQFGACLLVMLGAGAILLATTQFLPLLVQQHYGYTATWAGLVLSPGGLVTMAMMLIVGRVAGRMQPRWLIAAGALVVAVSMHGLTNVYADLDFWYFARSRMLLSIGLPLIFIPMLTASYNAVPQNRTDMASALINAARNTGGSIGAALGANVIAHREQFHQSRLVEHVMPSSPQYQASLQQAKDYFLAHGSTSAEAAKQAVAWIAQQVQQQAAFLAFDDLFWVLMLVSLAAVPLALSLRSVKLGGGPRAAH